MQRTYFLFLSLMSFLFLLIYQFLALKLSSSGKCSSFRLFACLLCKLGQLLNSNLCLRWQPRSIDVMEWSLLWNDAKSVSLLHSVEVISSAMIGTTKFLGTWTHFPRYHTSARRFRWKGYPSPSRDRKFPGGLKQKDAALVKIIITKGKRFGDFFKSEERFLTLSLLMRLFKKERKIRLISRVGQNVY